jgi:hypothetical protein
MNSRRFMETEGSLVCSLEPPLDSCVTIVYSFVVTKYEHMIPPFYVQFVLFVLAVLYVLTVMCSGFGRVHCLKRGLQGVYNRTLVIVPHTPSLLQRKCSHCPVTSYHTFPRFSSRAKQNRDTNSRPAYLLYNIFTMKIAIFWDVTPRCLVNVLPLFSGSGSQGRNQQESRSKLDRAIAQAVSRWLPTATVRVRAQVRLCGICDGQCGAGAGFLRVLRFPLSILIPPNYSTITIIYHVGIVQ